MIGPSAHLSWWELRCHDAIQTPYPLDLRSTEGAKLGIVFESIRTACGDLPITVDSAYRTPAFQVALRNNPDFHAAMQSQHVLGRAMDLRPPSEMMVDEFYRRIYRIAQRPGSLIGGIGWYRNRLFVHVDVRPRVPDGHLALWGYDPQGLALARIDLEVTT